MPPATVRFYFDYISSNAYLGWTQLPKLSDKYGFTIEPVPVLFAGLLEAHGQLGPAEIPAKAGWDEQFWGYDDFPYLELFLAGKDPLDATQWQKWFGAARPSAVRRRFRPRDEGD